MNRRTKRAKAVNFELLSEADKERVYRECEKLAVEDGKALSKGDRRLHERARRRGRPRVGAGAKRIQVTIEGGLLKRAEAFVRKHRMTRAQFLAEAVEAMLARAG